MTFIECIGVVLPIAIIVFMGVIVLFVTADVITFIFDKFPAWLGTIAVFADAVLITSFLLYIQQLGR